MAQINILVFFQNHYFEVRILCYIPNEQDGRIRTHVQYPVHIIDHACHHGFITFGPIKATKLAIRVKI